MCRGIHGTTCRRPGEVFRTEEAPALLPQPERPYDLPHYAEPKVHRDYHIEVGKALYSVPAAFIGQHVKVRADRNLVRIYHRGILIKTHPRKPPGGRSTDPADLPPEKAAYATRDLDRLRRAATAHGPSVGALAAAVLDGPKEAEAWREGVLSDRSGDHLPPTRCPNGALPPSHGLVFGRRSEEEVHALRRAPTIAPVDRSVGARGGP